MTEEAVEYHAVAKTDEIKDGDVMQVLIGRREIALFNVEGALYATDDMCTHAYASLADGYIEGDIIECPLHGGCFEIKTGKVASAPATEDLRTYPVKVEGDSILVGVPPAS